MNTARGYHEDNYLGKRKPAPAPETKKDTTRNQNNQPKPQSLFEVIGYYPKRRDFDSEHDPEAEYYIADLEFEDDDTERDIELKKGILEIYNIRLSERIRRKNFLIDHGILDLEKNAQIEKRPKEEIEVRKKLAKFARLMTPEKHEELIRNIMKLRDIKCRRKILEDLEKNHNCKRFDEVAEVA